MTEMKEKKDDPAGQALHFDHPGPHSISLSIILTVLDVCKNIQ